MQQVIWSRACVSTFLPHVDLRILVLEDGNKIVAIAPLACCKGGVRLEMLGVSTLFEPMDVVYADRDVLPALAHAMVDLRAPLLLRRVPADSPLTGALANAYRGRGTLLSRPDGPWPWITLDAGWAEPESKFNSKRRAYLRRARRIADQLGTVSHEILAPTPAMLPPLLEEALAVEAASWKGKTGTALALDPVIGTFYRRYAAAACEQGTLRLCFLRIDGRAAAMQMAIETGNRLWLMKIGYDEQFASCSPGNLLIRETIRHAALSGLKSIAFLGAVEPWKEQWTHEQNPCVVLRGYPSGFRGTVSLAGDIVKAGCAKLYHRKSTPAPPPSVPAQPAHEPQSATS